MPVARAVQILGRSRVRVRLTLPARVIFPTPRCPAKIASCCAGFTLMLVALSIDVTSAWAQGAREVRLSVTVVDQTNLVLPNATVRVTGEEEVTRARTIEPLQTSPQGIATFTRLVAGRYSIQADFPGFDTGAVTGVRL